MIRNKHKGWLTMVLSLLVICVYLACHGLGVASGEQSVPADAEHDPYDWTSYAGEVILDDPDLFLNTEAEVAAPDSGDSPLEETGGEQPAEEKHDGEASAEPTQEPAEPTEEPPTPTDEPITPTEQPPADLKTLFQVEIKAPAGWFNAASKAIRIRITPQSETMWGKIKYCLEDGEWTEIKEKFSYKDGYYYVDVDAEYNGLLTVRLLDAAGAYLDTKKEIRIFDHYAPEVTAGIQDRLLHVVALDDLSEVAGIQVNGLLFTTLLDGVLDVRIEDALNTYKQFAIRAYDYAGNFSDTVTLDNPYYQEPTPTPAPTKKPTTTKKPTATATTAPTAAPKPTKKPSGSAADTKTTEKPKETAVPTAEPTAFVYQEPIVILVTPAPTAEPAPSPTPETVYVPLGPGQPFHSSGNMQTLDVLYSASTNKQFITVQSRAGQTYYMVIDYDKPIDEDNEIYETYFLNLVDDRDLMSVLTEEEIVPTPTPQIIYVTPEPTEVPLPSQTPTEAPVIEAPEKNPDNASSQMMMLLIALLIGGAALWYFKFRNRKKNPSIPDYDEEEYEIDESDANGNSDSGE